MPTSRTPTPTLRQAILGSLLTPAGLFCCLVAVLIATCPGARGDGAGDEGQWLSDSLIAPAARVRVAGGSHAWGDAVVDVGPAVSMAAFDAPLMEERGPVVKFARSAAPDERSAGETPDADALGHSKAALPLLVDPMLAPSASAPRAAPRPLTGPAVGVVSPRTRFNSSSTASATPARQAPFSSLRGSTSR